LFTTDIQPGEILTEIEIPAFPENAGWSFVEFARRKGDYALAGVATWIKLDSAGRMDECRLVYLNVADVPIKAEKAAATLKGQAPGEKAFSAAAETASTEIDPIGSVHASPEFQRHLARVLTIRALQIAADRATTRKSNVQ
jgi:CO/xanthine dehydrogenase FAD-binding subunit